MSTVIEVTWSAAYFCFLRIDVYLIEILYEDVCRPPLTHVIWTTCFKFVGHTACTDLFLDHSRVIMSSVAPLPRDWNHRTDRSRQTWLWTVEFDFDIAPLNIGLATNCHQAQTRQAGRALMGTATFIGQAT